MIGGSAPPSVPPLGIRSVQTPPGFVGGFFTPPPFVGSGMSTGGVDVVRTGSGAVRLAVALAVAVAGSLRGRDCGAGSVDVATRARACAA